MHPTMALDGVGGSGQYQPHILRKRGFLFLKRKPKYSCQRGRINNNPVTALLFSFTFCCLFSPGERVVELCIIWGLHYVCIHQTTVPVCSNKKKIVESPSFKKCLLSLLGQVCSFQRDSWKKLFHFESMGLLNNVSLCFWPFLVLQQIKKFPNHSPSKPQPFQFQILILCVIVSYYVQNFVNDSFPKKEKKKKFRLI